MAKVTITVFGRKVKEYETKGNKMPDVAGFLREMQKLGIETKVKVSSQQNAELLNKYSMKNDSDGN